MNIPTRKLAAQRKKLFARSSPDDRQFVAENESTKMNTSLFLQANHLKKNQSVSSLAMQCVRILARREDLLAGVADRRVRALHRHQLNTKTIEFDSRTAYE